MRKIAVFTACVSGDNLGSDTNAVPVVIDTTTGLMGVTSSSRRYKEDIQDMGEASLQDLREWIEQLEALISGHLPR